MRADPAASLLPGSAARPVLRHATGAVVEREAFLRRAWTLAARLPAASNLINLCEDRGHFLLGFTAALLAGRVTLLPPARAPQVVAEIATRHAPAAILDDALVRSALADYDDFITLPVLPTIAPERVVVIGFTSGSTGVPKANAKTWRALVGSNRRNLDLLQALAPAATVLATVPSQHMYGLETCVLLPVLGEMALACERPLFPQDLRAALARLPQPVLLVTTPVHLRAFVEAGLSYPAPAAILSATAPLSRELAVTAERVFAAPLLEVFGSTETCVIAHRRTAQQAVWQLHPDLDLTCVADGTQVHAPYFDSPVLLHDHVRRVGTDGFVVEGRCQDMVEIAGKRASLGDITARLLAIPGVRDAAVVQADNAAAGGVQRIVAVVVAPELSDEAILADLRCGLDPAFLPRRLLRVAALPRNDTGKLQRDALLALLR